MLQLGLIKKRPKPADTVLEKIQTSQLLINDDDSSCCKQETLSLFPLEPTGVLQTRSSSSSPSSSSLASTSAVISTTAPSSSSAINGDHQPYFDFFSGSGCCESDWLIKYGWAGFLQYWPINAFVVVVQTTKFGVSYWSGLFSILGEELMRCRDGFGCS